MKSLSEFTTRKKSVILQVSLPFADGKEEIFTFGKKNKGPVETCWKRTRILRLDSRSRFSIVHQKYLQLIKLEIK
jgi:hypothetical protein